MAVAAFNGCGNVRLQGGGKAARWQGGGGKEEDSDTNNQIKVAAGGSWRRTSMATAGDGGYGNRWQWQWQWQRHFQRQWWQAATVVMAGYGGEGKSSVMLTIVPLRRR